MTKASDATRRVTITCLTAIAVAVSTADIPVATATAADACPNAAVREQQHSGKLPNCRAYEIVNPPTSDVGETNRVSSIADDGNAVAYMSVIPGNNALGGAIASTAVARRAADGWTSLSADPVSRSALFGTAAVAVPLAFSPDFSRELVLTNLTLVPTDLNGGGDNYALDVGPSTPTLLTQGASVRTALGATPSFDRIVFLASTPTTGIYASDGNSLELLSLFPDGTALGPNLAWIAGSGYQRGLGVGEDRDVAPWVEHGGNHGVSDDTRRVYFYDHFASGGTGYLYLRDHQRTVVVSRSTRAGDVVTVHLASFIAASHDGSVAYLVSPDQLTNAATPGGGIYRFDLASETLTQITPNAGDPTGLHMAGAMASDDNSHVYFTSTSALEGSAQAGDNNAYVWTSGGGVRFLARAGNLDRFVRVTANGRYALMLSTASIDGAPNNGQQAAYRFNGENGEITCVSCRPDGSPSQGTAEIEGQSYGFPGSQITHNRSLTLNGSVAFTSSDRIAPTDQTSATDVYLYDQGKVSLLTAGRGDNNSYVGDISDDGRNIFVYTRSALVGADVDPDEFDVYDVRVNGGFLEPKAVDDPCHGSDCQQVSSPAPDKYAPSTADVGGTGNATSTTIRKLSMSTLTSDQRSALARTGKIAISVRVTGGGTLSVRGRGRIAGKTRILGSASATVLKKTTTTVKVTFKLSTAARHELSRRHRLAVTLEARLSGSSKVVTTTAGLNRKP